MSHLAALLAIQDSLVEATSATRATKQIGGFTAMLHPHDPLIWLNYAVPVSEPTEADIEEMSIHFIAQKRTPRLEFFADLWPDTIRLLEKSGFECEKTMPVMILPQADWKPLVGKLTAREGFATDLQGVRQVANISFGMPELDATPDPESIQALESAQHLVSCQEIDGKIVGSGYAVGSSKIREIAGIATLPEFRRRGVATAVIANLLDRFFQDGGEQAWLTPGDDGAQALYERLGFRSIATQVCYVRPVTDQSS